MFLSSIHVCNNAYEGSRRGHGGIFFHIVPYFR
jgi:hypothetical protein